MKDYFPLKNNKTYGRYRKLVYFMKFEQFLESPISKYSILYFLKKTFESLSVYEQTFC